MTWLEKLVGAKFAKPVIYGTLALILVIAVLVLSRCGGSDTSQVEQTSASSEAISNAAAGAIATIGNRAVTDRDIDDAVGATLLEINNAENPDDIRNAVLIGVCRQKSHADDPACVK